MCIRDRPILEDLYDALLKQDEKEAHHVATALEIYVKGSLKLFNNRTNVDIQNRLVCFDIKEPVSYTHLDVYKRQGEECANCPYTLDEREHGICRRCAVFKK